jgi:peptidoglycan/LPS O-acetylase OafA/YrhL
MKLVQDERLAVRENAPVAVLDAGRSRSAREYGLLDAWRGAAAMGVVAFHATTLITREVPAMRSEPFFRLSVFGSLGVQLFFVISGYCIANSAAGCLKNNRGTMSFLSSRFWRVYPTMWLSLLLYVTLFVIGRLLVSHGLRHTSTWEHPPQFTPWFILTNATLTQLLVGNSFVVGVCWSLCYEVAFYLMVSLALMAAARSGGRLSMLYLLHGLTLIVLVLLIAVPARVPYPFNFWPQFGLGILVYDLVTSPWRRPAVVLSVLAALLMLVFVVLRDLPLGFIGAPSRLTFAVSLAFAAALALLHRYDKALTELRCVGWFAAAGTFSYSLYLTHFWTLTVTHQVLKGISLTGLNYLRFVIFVVASILFARFFYRFGEQPFVRRKHAMAAVNGRRADFSQPEGSISEKHVTLPRVFGAECNQ